MNAKVKKRLGELTDPLAVTGGARPLQYPPPLVNIVIRSPLPEILGTCIGNIAALWRRFIQWLAIFRFKWNPFSCCADVARITTERVL